MQRISTILQKIEQLANQKDHDMIEIDLMMDYTKILYADLLTYRTKKISSNNVDVTQAVQSDTIPAPNVREGATPSLKNETYARSANVVEWEVPHNKNKQQAPVEDFDANDEQNNKNVQKDIRTFIGINDKYQIISELFANKKPEYELMIDTLNAMDTELNALHWLQDNLYFEYSWRENSEALMILHAIMHKYYSGK